MRIPNLSFFSITMTHSTSAIRVVIFDCGSVLAPDNNYSCLYSALEPEQRPLIDAAIARAWNVIKVEPDAKVSEFWISVLSDVGLDSRNWQYYDEGLTSLFTAFWETFALASRLKARGYVVGVISNYNVEWFDFIFDKYALREIFDEEKLIVVSASVRAAKPLPEIYKIFLERLAETHPDIGNNAGACVFIDDKAANVEAARKVGMHAIHYNANVSSINHLTNALVSMGINAAL